MVKKVTERTQQDFLNELAEKDMTLKGWASANGFSFNAVYMVLHGRTKGTRGEARRVLRAMGLALPPIAGNGCKLRTEAA